MVVVELIEEIFGNLLQVLESRRQARIDVCLHKAVQPEVTWNQVRAIGSPRLAPHRPVSQHPGSENPVKIGHGGVRGVETGAVLLQKICKENSVQKDLTKKSQSNLHPSCHVDSTLLKAAAPMTP